MVDVSIIIVNWNTRQLLEDCLRSIERTTGNVAYEVVVIDNASQDDSAQMVKDKFPDVRLIENNDNRGFSAANNQGMTVAQGEYVLLLNSDTVVLDDAIEKTIAFARQSTTAAVVGCRVLNPDRTLQPTCFRFPSVLNLFLSTTYLYKMFPKSEFFGRERMTWWNRDDVRQVDVVTGCFMLVRREAIEQVGAMDENFYFYGEETDWCCRFKQAGWKCLFTPDAEIIHLGGQSSQKVRVQSDMQLRASLLQFMKKHRSKGAYLVSCCLVWLFFVLRLPYWALKALLSQNRSYARGRLTVCIKVVFGMIFHGASVLAIRKRI
ncbi:MAG: glycosyltransferase family 2 protein [Planctomycetota bacterium]|jgi:GT2 family glycosyltransferase